MKSHGSHQFALLAQSSLRAVCLLKFKRQWPELLPLWFLSISKYFLDRRKKLSLRMRTCCWNLGSATELKSSRVAYLWFLPSVSIFSSGKWGVWTSKPLRFLPASNLSKIPDLLSQKKKVGLKLNIQKPKIMTSGSITSWQIFGKTLADFILGGSKITADGDCSHEIKRHLLLGRKVMTNLDSILKSRDITLLTKVHLVRAMVFPVVMDVRVGL